jgi:hypothetical protein
MQVTLKSLLLALGIIALLLVIVGVISWQKPTYGCYPDTSNKFEWKEKVLLFQWGSFKVYGYPLIKDCPQENRYDPKKSIDMQRIE